MQVFKKSHNQKEIMFKDNACTPRHHIHKADARKKERSRMKREWCTLVIFAEFGEGEASGASEDV